LPAQTPRSQWAQITSKRAVLQIVKEKQNFQRVVVSREEALSMFQENKFKVEIITGLPENATISLYRRATEQASSACSEGTPHHAVAQRSHCPDTTVSKRDMHVTSVLLVEMPAGSPLCC
jgi:threonyl-tRNA synthetase